MYAIFCLFLQRWELFVKITHLLQKILQRRSLRFVTAAKMDSPVHFGQKRRANPDGAINLPRAYFVTLKISLQNFGKSFWRKLKKHRQNKPLPVLSPFTALLSPGSRGSKGVKRVKWGFPDIYEVKSVSRWQGQIIEGSLRGWNGTVGGWTGEDGGFPGLFEIVTIVGWLGAVASIAFAFCSCESWKQVKVKVPLFQRFVYHLRVELG